MKNLRKYILMMAAVSSICVGTSLKADAAAYYKKTMELKQPDDSTVKVKVTGDEYYSSIESIDGYTLCRNDEGWICYADKDGDDLSPSEEVYTGDSYKDNRPLWQKIFKNSSDRVKHLSASNETIEKEREKNKEELNAAKSEESESITFNNYANKAKSSSVEKINGLTLLIDFPDVKSDVSKDEISDFVNKEGYNGFSNNGSVRDYFNDISGGAVDYTNTVTEFYTAKHEKSYYDNVNSTDYGKALELVREALNWLRSSGFDFSTLSVDENGEPRAVNILYAGNADAGWSNGLWPHQGYIPEGFYSNGVNIHRYELSNIGTDLSLDTMCHEDGHLLFGFPDLYDYSNASGGCGTYSIMSYISDVKNPAPPDPYCRNIITGWNTTVDLNSINNSKIEADSSDNGTQKVYKWSNSANPKEYYLIENLERKGRYRSIPDDGLIIWHIDENGENSRYEGTAYRHYQVAVVQADNKREIEKNINSGGAGDLFYAGYKDTFNYSTSPSSKWWNDTDSGLNISNISAKGNIMTFVAGNLNDNTGGGTSGGSVQVPSEDTDVINIASKASVSTSYCSSWESIEALNDGYTPVNSNDRNHKVYGNWPETGTQWVQYNFDNSYIISKCDIYWFKDWFKDWGGIDVPSSYKIKYWDGSAWKTVKKAVGLGTLADTFNTTTFTPVKTNAIRIEMNSNSNGASTGILEWSVY